MTSPTARRIAGRLAVIGVLVSIAAAGCSPEPVAVLPALGTKADEVSTSGISSGAYMAGQFQIAHSSKVAGAAIIAGGPYGCAESLFADMMPGPGTAFLNLSKAINGCMLNALMPWGVPSPRLLAEKANKLAAEGRIDAIAGVAGDRVYLFAGQEDRTVVPPIVATAADFYARLGLIPAQIKHVTRVAAGHAFVTDDQGLACERSGKPYVVDCDYDQAGDLLQHIYGPLEPRAAQLSGAYRVFDQSTFTQDLPAHGLSDQGVIYIPRSCAEQVGCRVHVAFHGCAQNRAAVDDAFVTGSGLARWADTNRMVVLFPQTESSPLNPQGCWDWWGYTGRDYLTREAPQIVAVARMLDRLAAARSP